MLLPMYACQAVVASGRQLLEWHGCRDVYSGVGSALNTTLNTATIARSGAKELATARRLEIALDVGLGLAYLHSATPAVIHRDVKGWDGCLTDCLT
jgi:hypothetical protein